jgi:hypothetical protein
MTNHPVAYRIDGDSYNSLPDLRKGGIIDVDFIVHGGGNYPPQQFITDAVAAGLTPGLNNGNDGKAGWDGTNAYVNKLKSMGIVVVGGESEQAAEIDAYMDAGLIFLDLGGEGTPGGYQDDIWRVTHPGMCHGAGAVSYFETYDSQTNFWDWSVIGQACIDAKAHGVKEIGVLVGSWMMAQTFQTRKTVLDKKGKEVSVEMGFDHEGYFKAIAARSTAQNYLDLAAAIEAHGITFGGFYIWSGYGTNMNKLYEKFKSWIDQWQVVWPPTDITMATRIGDIPVPPTPPKPPEPIEDGDPYAVAITSDGTRHYFKRGVNQDLQHRTPLSDWSSLGGILTSGPAAVGVDNDVYIAVRGADKDPSMIRSLYIRTLTKGWLNIGGLGTSSPEIAATTNEPRITVCVRGNDEACWEKTLNVVLNVWSAWKSMGGAKN